MLLILLTSILSLVSLVLAEEGDVASSIIKNEVKCFFIGSDRIQSCFTYGETFKCSGIGNCVAEVSGELGSRLEWKSSCSGSGTTVINSNSNRQDIEFRCKTASYKPKDEPKAVEAVKRSIKCFFVGSDQVESCYSEDEKFRCSGVGMCEAEVVAATGSKQQWRSSCSIPPSKVIYGSRDYAEFKCDPKHGPSTKVKELVKCVFKNSDKTQECYAPALATALACKGKGACLVDVSGLNNEKLTWKSSCGGYAYTVTDGNNEYAEFNCLPNSKVSPEVIHSRTFRYAYWQCYSGDNTKQGSEAECKSADDWENSAREFCRNKCNTDNNKCGINSFSLISECYVDSKESEPEEVEKQETTSVEPRLEEVLICKDSCPLDGKCYPFGYRKAKQFCSDQGAFLEQLTSDSSCENNFECSSNVCVDSKCISAGLLEKLLSWFRSFVG